MESGEWGRYILSSERKEAELCGSLGRQNNKNEGDMDFVPSGENKCLKLLVMLMIDLIKLVTG